MARATYRRTIAAATLAITSLLAACSGGGDPADPNSSSPSPSPTEVSASPSPSPSASAAAEKPERPAAMEKQDAEAAAAALEHFLSLDQYAMATGDVAPLDAMSHQSCEYCDSRIEQAQTIAERGDKYSGGLATATVVTIFERDPVTGILPLDVRINEEPATITDVAGEEVFSSEGGTADRRVEMGIVEGQWVVVEIGPIPEG